MIVLALACMRIRSFGFLANRSKKQGLARIRELLAHIPHPDSGLKTPRTLMLELTGIDIERCPSCGNGAMRVVVEFQPCHPGKVESLPFYPAVLNSS